MTEPDNPALDSLFNNTSQLTIEFQARQQTLALNRNFLTKWNFGNNGTIAIATGSTAGRKGDFCLVRQFQRRYRRRNRRHSGANLQASVTYDIAVVFNAGQVQIYVNGQPQSTYVKFGSDPHIAGRVEQRRRSTWAAGTDLGRYLDGSIAESEYVDRRQDAGADPITRRETSFLMRK